VTDLINVLSGRSTVKLSDQSVQLGEKMLLKKHAMLQNAEEWT
jgi:hypothetical protein